MSGANPVHFVRVDEEVDVEGLLPVVIVPAGIFQPAPERTGEGRNGITYFQNTLPVGPLWAGRYEVSNELWTTLTGDPPPGCEAGWRSKGGALLRRTCRPNWPLSEIGMEQAAALANAMSYRLGLDPAYSSFSREDGSKCIHWERAAGGFRVPSVGEWEYLARAGTEDRYSGTDDPNAVCDYANVFQAANGREPSRGVCDDGFYGPAPIGSFKPNNFGIYDLTGNLAEPVWVVEHDGQSTEPEDWCSGDVMLVKGGAMLASTLLVPPAVTQEFERWNGRPSPAVGLRFVRNMPILPADKSGG